MNELLDKNLEALERRYPGIRQLIEEKKEELLKEEDLHVLEEENLEGIQILRVLKGERNLYLAGKRSAYAPVQNMMHMFGKIEASAPIFLVGMGNICYLEEILRVTGKENVVLVYEPSFTIFYEQLQRIDMDEMLGKKIVVLLVGGINDMDLKPLMENILQGDRVPLMKHYILPNYEELCLEKVHRFENALAEVARSYRMNKGTERRFSGVWVENLFRNADYIRKGYQVNQMVEILPKDIPAIIVSAGPSLNKNIGQLKKAKNKAFIIAVDTAIKPLIREGILPDIYAIVDGLKPLELVKVEECRKVPLVTTAYAANAVLEYHQGKKFFFEQAVPFVNEMYRINDKVFYRLPIGGSVATLAFSLACHLGFRTIIFVGQDLALTGNKTHADGTFKEIMDIEDTTKLKKVPGNCEEWVPTRGDFNNYRIWFQNFIEEWRKHDELRVINATEGGARIEGTEIMTLQEAIERECGRTVDIAACFDSLRPVFDEKEQSAILDYFHNISKELQKIAQLAEQGRKLYQKLDRMSSGGNNSQDAYLKVLNKIKKNTKNIEKNPQYELVRQSLAVADQIIKAGQHLEYQSFDKECKEIAEHGMKFMELNKECAELLGQLAKDTLVQDSVK